MYITAFQPAFRKPMAPAFTGLPTKQVISSQPPTKDMLTFGAQTSLLVIDPANATNEQFQVNVFRLFQRREQIGQVTDLPIGETGAKISWHPLRTWEFMVTRPNEGILEVYTIAATGQPTVTSLPLEEVEGLNTLAIALVISKHQLESNTTLSYEQVERLMGAMAAVYNHEQGQS